MSKLPSLTLDRNNVEDIDFIAEVIADREFGCREGRWKRTMEYALRGGGYSAATINRLRATAADVITVVNRRAAAQSKPGKGEG